MIHHVGRTKRPLSADLPKAVDRDHLPPGLSICDARLARPHPLSNEPPAPALRCKPDIKPSCLTSQSHTWPVHCFMTSHPGNANAEQSRAEQGAVMFNLTTARGAKIKHGPARRIAYDAKETTFAPRVLMLQTRRLWPSNERPLSRQRDATAWLCLPGRKPSLRLEESAASLKDRLP